MTDIVLFKLSSHLEECLETLTIKITTGLPLLAAAVGPIVDRLSHLRTLDLDVASRVAYQLLYRHPIRAPSLTTARFSVEDEASAEAVMRLVELYPAIRSVFVHALGGETAFESPSARAQGWTRFRPYHYKLNR